MTINPDKSINAIYLAGEDELTLPEKISISSFNPEKDAKIYLLGYSKPLKWEKTENGFSISIPAKIQKNPPCQHAWSFRISEITQQDK